MPNLLIIESSPRGPYSASRRLAERFAAGWHAKHDDNVVVRDLGTSNAPYISLPSIESAFALAEQHSPEMTDATKVYDEYIADAGSVAIGLTFMS